MGTAVGGLLALIAAACSGDATAPTQTTRTAPAATIDFDGASTHGTPFAIYREYGYLVMPYSGPWTVSTTYGRPAPFIQFLRAASEDTTTGEIRVSADGARFRFSSIDLYSSITTIPYSFSGFLGSTMVFSFAGTVPNTFGNFATVTNPHARDVIEGLVIRVTNPQCTLVNCQNPVGLDNIVVGF